MKKVKQSISIRLIRNIILVSTFFSIIATSAQLYSIYKNEKEFIKREIEQVKQAYIESLNLSLWQKNDEQIHIQLKNLLKIEPITYASIKEEEGGDQYSYGENISEDSISKTYELTYTYNYTKYSLGTLTLQAGLSHARNMVKENFYLIAVSQTTKTFIVAFIMLYIFSYMITRHLYKIADYADDMIKHKVDKPLKLNLTRKDDEFYLLQESLNTLYRSMYSKIEMSEAQKRELQELNMHLQERVDENEYMTDPTVNEEDVKEILDMLSFVKRDSTDKKYAEILQQDIASLEILIKRTLRVK